MFGLLGALGISWASWAVTDGVIRSSTVEAKMIFAAKLSLFIAQSLKGATGNGTLRRVGSGAGGGGRGGLFAKRLSRRWNGWSWRVAAFQASFVETVVYARGQVDEGSQDCWSLRSGKLVFVLPFRPS